MQPPWLLSTCSLLSARWTCRPAVPPRWMIKRCCVNPTLVWAFTQVHGVNTAASCTFWFWRNKSHLFSASVGTLTQLIGARAHTVLRRRRSVLMDWDPSSDGTCKQILALEALLKLAATPAPDAVFFEVGRGKMGCVSNDKLNRACCCWYRLQITTSRSNLI